MNHDDWPEVVLYKSRLDNPYDYYSSENRYYTISSGPHGPGGSKRWWGYSVTKPGERHRVDNMVGDPDGFVSAEHAIRELSKLRQVRFRIDPSQEWFMNPDLTGVRLVPAGQPQLVAGGVRFESLW